MCNEAGREFIFIKLTNIIEVQQIIKQLINKVGGLDYLHAKVLKEAATYISKQLSLLFNKCLGIGYCPMHF